MNQGHPGQRPSPNISMTSLDLQKNSLIADMGTREEISNTDIGTILHSYMLRRCYRSPQRHLVHRQNLPKAPECPPSPSKDVTTHTRAVKLKQQSLQDRLELCLLELRKLCIREAELTGKLSSDYPLLPGEKPPVIRRRIGAAFKLDEESFQKDGEDSELHALEFKLALQTQIYEAARRLSLEEHLSRQVRRSRVHDCKLQERKMKELQEAVFQLRLKIGRSSPRPHPGSSVAVQKDVSAASDDSSLSDAAGLDEEEGTAKLPHQSSEVTPLPELHLPSWPTSHLQSAQSLEGLRPSTHTSLTYEPSPIQNSPWKESSLDQPYERPKKSLCTSSHQPCLIVAPVSTPVDLRLGEPELPLQVTPIKNLRQVQSNSAPSTPDLHLRRQHSLRIASGIPHHDPDHTRGRSPLATRRVSDLPQPTTEYLPLRPTLGSLLYQCNSEDSSSECSTSSYASSPLHEAQGDLSGLSKGQHYASHYSSPLGYPRPMAFTGPSFYKIQHHQFTPSFYRGFVEDRIGYPAEMDTGYVRVVQPQVGRRSRCDFWSEYEEPLQQWVLQPRPTNTRLTRVPSLRDYPTYHCQMSYPREMVSDELRSWQQRSQGRTSRPHSLDRQGAIRVRSLQGRESPLIQTHKLPEQAFQKRVIHRPSDGTPIQWFIEEDSQVIS